MSAPALDVAQLRADLRTALRKGWTANDDIREWCVYCEAEILPVPMFVCICAHAPDCLMVKYADLLAEETRP